MVKLSASQESFIILMTKSEEHARKGFELLVSRSEPEYFFDAIAEADLFSASNNQGPVPADEPGYSRIPYWAALDYLEVVARRSDETNNPVLSQKVLEIIRNVSNQSTGENHHTWRKFAEILSIFPTSAISVADLDLIPRWLDCKYERGMVAHVFDQGALQKLLDSQISDDWRKACRILYHCTAIRSEDDSGRGEGCQKLVTIVDGYWLKKMVNNHSVAFGKKCNKEAAGIFKERVGEYFRNEIPSIFKRPAVEEHPQNHQWEHSSNALVEGLRDVVVSWVEQDPSSSQAFVADMLNDDCEMVRRIGIYILGEHWTRFVGIFAQVNRPPLFTSSNIHELYNLLRTRFLEFTETEQAAVIETLRQLSPPTTAEDPERSLRRTQRQWLSAVTGKGCEIADSWYAELNDDPTIGKLSEHPDFHVYMESSSGPGPSPYVAAELIVFAERGALIDNLNDFTPKSTWRGPSRKALVDELENAVQQNPEVFLRALPTFVDAQRPYQYGVISGFKKLWDSSAKNDVEQPDWQQVWQGLLDYFWRILSAPEFWTEEVTDDDEMTPTRDWIPPMIAEFLLAGTRRDEYAYPSELLPVGWRLIQLLLEKGRSVPESREDAMTQAINSMKGKAIEALFNHALRVCRLAERDERGHVDQWAEMQPIFDREIAKCSNGNYEFSTLAASYLGNLEYLDQGWLKENLNRIFPEQFQSNYNCALEGLSFAQATRSNYRLLVEGSIIDHALQRDYKGKHARERIIQRICLAFLWGDEDLELPRFHWMFENHRLDDLTEASNFFWSVSNQELEDEQKQRIMKFFGKCVSLANDLFEPPKELLSSISRLSCYLPVISAEAQAWLLAVAPYVNINHNTTDFIEDLDRLADICPTEVTPIIGLVLSAHPPLYDYDAHLESLLVKLINAGKHEEVIVYADHLRKTLPRLADEIFSRASVRARQ